MKIRKGILILLAVMVLSGCSDGTSATDVSTEPEVTELPIAFETVPKEPVRRVTFNDCVTSQEGNTEYHFQIDQEFATDALSVVEVTPRWVSGEDAKRMAEVLMPGAAFFKARSHMGKLSKQELQRKIDLYSEFADASALKELYGRENPEDLEMVSYYINFWGEQQEKTTEEKQKLCDWQLRPEREHFDYPEEIGDRPLWEDDDCMFAVTYVDGVEYLLDAGQYRMNEMEYSVLGLSRHYPGEFEDQVLCSRIFRTEEPDDDCIKKLTAQAEDWLNRMELGRWKVVETKVQRNPVGDALEYRVSLEAEPVINGLTGMKEAYGGNFRPHASFILSAKGDLYYFDLYCPIEEGEVLHGQLAPLTMELIQKKAGEYLAARNSLHVLGSREEAHRLKLEKQAGEKVVRKTEISRIEFRMGQVPVPNSQNRYYYMPVAGFLGTSEYYGADSGKQYEGLPEDGELRPILWVDSFEGNIVETN